VQGQAVALGDLAGAVGEQGQVAVVQLGDQLPEYVVGLLDVGADQPGGRALPDGQLDQLGVEQRELDRGVQGSHRDQELEDVGLAGPGLPTEQEVALGEGDGDLGAVLVDPDGDRLPQRQPLGLDQRPRHRGGVGQRVTAQDDRAGVACTRRVAGDADLADGQEGGDALSLGLQVGHLGAGGDADPELLAGPGEPAAGDPGDAVVAGCQLGMAAGQRPPAAQVGPEQGPG
jgi:hypothetical protein